MKAEPLWFASLARKVRYKNYQWHYDAERRLLWASFVSQDNFDPQLREVQSTRKWYLSLHATDSEILQTMLKLVLTSEEHEAREQFLVEGRAIFGPHVDWKVLWYDAGKTDKRAAPPTAAELTQEHP
jgi:hypothetical protein